MPRPVRRNPAWIPSLESPAAPLDDVDDTTPSEPLDEPPTVSMADEVALIQKDDPEALAERGGYHCMLRESERADEEVVSDMPGAP